MIDVLSNPIPAIYRSHRKSFEVNDLIHLDARADRLICLV